jgi:hypothetical protein
MFQESNAVIKQLAYLNSTIRYDYVGIFTISLLLGLTMLSNYELHNRIVSNSHAGFSLSSTYHSGFFANTTVIETDIGRYLVSGQLHLSKGQALVVEERGDGKHLLCLMDDSVCNPLVL